MASSSKEWEDWKREQVKAVPRHARKRMRELLNGVPGPPTEWNGGIKRLRQTSNEFQRLLGGKNWRRHRGKE